MMLKLFAVSVFDRFVVFFFELKRILVQVFQYFACEGLFALFSVERAKRFFRIHIAPCLAVPGYSNA